LINQITDYPREPFHKYKLNLLDNLINRYSTEIGGYSAFINTGCSEIVIILL